MAPRQPTLKYQFTFGHHSTVQPPSIVIYQPTIFKVKDLRALDQEIVEVMRDMIVMLPKSRDLAS